MATLSSHVHDENYPAYTIGTAADLVGSTPAFLRALDDAGLVTPQRSAGGHRRYSRHQLDLAARARELLDEGLPLTAACRIVRLEDELADVRRQLAELRATIPPPRAPLD
ncbi:MerR family transcriptional regulator [Catenuloplanes sp. NPDC051500]|uniref:MerR family transcriptional regulator n=1 Tax=Catenuloplanes sp. NPDC051500 TaxID=3363959 RepID=UPI0037B3AE40